MTNPSTNSMSTRRQPRAGLITIMAAFVTLPVSSSAFQSLPSIPQPAVMKPQASPQGVPYSRISSSRLFSSGGGGGFGSNPNQKIGSNNSPPVKSSPAGDFAYQEMVVLLTAMQKEGVTSRTMNPTQRQELEGYVRTVLKEQKHKSLPLQHIGQALVVEDPVTGGSSGSEWKLMFSTSDAVLESLPSDATVFLKIRDTTSLDYTLKFSKKTMGLDSLTAQCHYEVDVSKQSRFNLVFCGCVCMLQGVLTKIEFALFCFVTKRRDPSSQDC